MSEEVTNSALGLAPGKRPLDLSSDLSADTDDSTAPIKRIRVNDEDSRDDTSKVSNVVSNGEVDSPTSPDQDASPTSNGDDKHSNSHDSDQESTSVAHQAASTEATEESDGANLTTITDSKCEDSSPCNAENKASEAEDTETATASCNIESTATTEPDQSEHSAKISNSSSLTASDLESTDVVSSCNGNTESKDSNHKVVTESQKECDIDGVSDSVNGTDGETEDMEVDDSKNDDVSSSNTKQVAATTANEQSSESDSVNESGVPMDTANSSDAKLLNNCDQAEHVQDPDTESKEQKDESESSDKTIAKIDAEADSTVEADENGSDTYVDCLHKLTNEQQEARINVIKKLHEELRNEETKLLLLKKLRLNQQQPPSVPNKQDSAAGGASGQPVAPSSAHNVHRTGLPPNLGHSSIAGSKPRASIQPQTNTTSSHRSEMPQLVRGTHMQRQVHHYQKGHSGPPPLIMAQQPGRTATSQSGQTVRAPVVRISTSASAAPTTTHSMSRQAQQAQQAQQSSRQAQMANDGQSAASRQAAAKLALRKQLEKTLLQIPPPKPPPPELHFLPSAANNEFIILVGLEEVVNTILDMDKKDKNVSKGFVQPFRCGQCHTDFTTIWKQVKVDPKLGIMCEACIVSNQKKALKAEHTNRLKTAFVKALQQEQEIEQRIQQSQSSAPQHSASRVSSVQRHRPPQVVHRSHLSGMHHASNSQSSKQRVLNPAPSQRIVQPIHYAYIPNLPVSAPQIQIIPKQQLMASHRSSADRQREYLLDMIPSKALGHPQNTVIWKR